MPYVPKISNSNLSKTTHEGKWDVSYIGNIQPPGRKPPISEKRPSLFRGTLLIPKLHHARHHLAEIKRRSQMVWFLLAITHQSYRGVERDVGGEITVRVYVEFSFSRIGLG